MNNSVLQWNCNNVMLRTDFLALSKLLKTSLWTLGPMPTPPLPIGRCPRKKSWPLLCAKKKLDRVKTHNIIFPDFHAFILDNTVFAMCQILLGWKTCEYYYETNELPNPRPTQPKKRSKWHLGRFSPQQIICPGSWDWFLYRKQTARNPTQPNSSQTLYFPIFMLYPR